MANSPNLEKIIEDDLEDNAKDEKFFYFFCGRDFKTKHQRLQHPTTEL